MSFTTFLFFLALTSLSSLLFLHLFSFNIIVKTVPSNNNNNKISDVAVLSNRLPNIVGHGEELIFHHFWLDITWPFGYCSRKTCKGKEFPLEFGIHGLWPVDKNGATLNGTGSKIDIEKELRKHPALKKNMEKGWPNFENFKIIESYYEFWRYEWSKHGTACPQPIFNNNPVNYFNTSFNIYRKLKLMDTLERNNIKPVSDPSFTYQQKKFREAIKSSISNNDVILRCNVGSRQILESVTLCVASDATTLIPCSQSKEIRRNNCDNSIKFLSKVIK